ncbi:TPA: bundle-forming pilus assembly protein BfpL, partial [Escherichia coli]
MLFFWCGFFSLIVSILNISMGYNDRLFLDEQNRIIKENIYV